MHGGCFSYIVFLLFRVVRGGSPKGSPRGGVSAREYSAERGSVLPNGVEKKKLKIIRFTLGLLTTKNNITV